MKTITKSNDFIVANGADAFKTLPETAPEPDGPYVIDHGRLCRVRRTRDGRVIDPLCNFVARVTEEVVLDDGAEVARAFMIDGTLDTGAALPRVSVPATRFGGMTWVTEQWGLRAIVWPGMSTRDCLRAAIQTLSPSARSRHLFTHTGWRQTDGRWIYLTAAGAVGAQGYEVDLGPELARYALPPEPDDPVGAMRASLDLLRSGIAPMKVMVPLWSAIYRAPTATVLPVDVSIWLEGTTGSLKSTLAALLLAHYGPFDRLHLPGVWTSTANQLERRAFLLKDTVFVIDDYAPSALDARELELKAARLLRGVGNHAGRGRLRADLTERPSYPPRGIVVATGEQHPPGQSILARTLVLELDRASVNLGALTAAQEMASRLPHAMAGFIRWLAAEMPTLGQRFAEGFTALRHRASEGAGHLRLPEAVAHLYLGLDLALAYAVDAGACSASEAHELGDQAWQTLIEITQAQGGLIETERPSGRFFKVLLTLLIQGQGVLLHRDAGDGDGRPDLLGWQDDEALYLLSEASWHAVTRFCRETGEPFPIREDRLRRDLAKEGLSDGVSDRHTASIRIGGRKRRVVRIKRAPAEAIVGESFPEPPGTVRTSAER